MRLLVFALIAAFTTACSTVPKNSNGLIEPVDAILAAHNDPLYGVRGEFVLTVNGLNSFEKESYLNSEADYRDRKSLNIRMPTSIVPGLEQRLGVAFQDLKGRKLTILGVAKRVRIDFVENGRRTGKFYYQTQVHVHSPTQVKLAE